MVVNVKQLLDTKTSTLTSDTEILETVAGAKIEFIGNQPSQGSYSPNTVCKNNATKIDEEIKSLLAKKCYSTFAA